MTPFASPVTSAPDGTDDDFLAADGSIWIAALPADWLQAAAPAGGEFGVIPAAFPASAHDGHACS